MEIKNISQLKKWLGVGKRIQFLYNAHKPATAQGGIREVVKVQTNGFYTDLNGQPMWLEYPRAKDVVFNADGTVDFLIKGIVWLKIRPSTQSITFNKKKPRKISLGFLNYSETVITKQFLKYTVFV
nr:hypothetical protein [Lysinibacillus timonensis]